MGDYQPFHTLIEASNRAKEITLGNFSLGAEDMTDGAQALVRSFNCYWETQIYSLYTQLKYFLINILQAQQYKPDQFGFGPGLAVCGKLKEVKDKIDIEELIRFVKNIYRMEFYVVFTTPEVEASETQALKKRTKA